MGLVAGALALVIALGAPFGLLLLNAAQNARDDARTAAVAAQVNMSKSMPGMNMGTSTPSMDMTPGKTATQSLPAAQSSASAGTTATLSYAGIAPSNADALAMAHKPFPAALAPAPAGPVAHVTLGIHHATVSIAPGIKYNAWTFGDAAPGPAIHVRQGQTVKVTLVNDAPMPHSVDFHAAQIAPNVAFTDVAPGKSATFSFKATTPGVFMYHCGTAPAFMHIANGMYGAIVVEPKGMPHADRQYVLVSSEWYLDRAGDAQAADLDLTKALHMTPDWVTFNGYAAQYKTHPLTADPGDTVRFWVVDAGPSLNTEFHVVGTVLHRAWIDAGLTDTPEHDVQTAIVPAGGGGVFDVKIDHAGIYPFVSHSFAGVQMGEVGLLNVGHVAGTMSH
jgi:nitrite reductase (NO-forming)